MDEIHLMNALIQVTNVSAKDCIVNDDLVTFLVKEEDVGKAIGKKAINVNKLQDKLKRRIEIIGWQKEPEKIISKTLEIEFKNAKNDGNKLIISMDSINKRKAMTSGAKIKRIRKLIKRNFDKELILI
jgi:NusA-like KH domain protein